MNARIAGSLLLIMLGLLMAATPAREPVPLTNVHAHNDYEHPRPFFDALECGFCSFEADIHLVDGKLLVAHDRKQVKPDRTLQSLYLDPMRQRIKQNGGRLYPDGPTVVLLIDFKSDPAQMYPVLREVLKQYADILTTWTDGKERQGAVKAILTGDHPDENIVAAEHERYAAIDGKLEDLEKNPPAELVPWISGQWGRTFRWHGSGPFTDDELRKLKEIVAKTHAQHRQLRFWGAPDTPAMWAILRDAGVDLINTDDLKGVRQFLLGDQSRPAR